MHLKSMETNLCWYKLAKKWKNMTIRTVIQLIRSPMPFALYQAVVFQPCNNAFSNICWEALWSICGHTMLQNGQVKSRRQCNRKKVTSDVKQAKGVQRLWHSIILSHTIIESMCCFQQLSICLPNLVFCMPLELQSLPIEFKAIPTLGLSLTIFSNSHRKLINGVVHSVDSSIRVYMWTSLYQTVTKTEMNAEMWWVTISQPPICKSVQFSSTYHMKSQHAESSTYDSSNQEYASYQESEGMAEAGMSGADDMPWQTGWHGEQCCSIIWHDLRYGIAR